MNFPEACSAARSVRINIDLSAIRHNFSVAKKTAGSNLFAVVKADAYGHGAVAVATTLRNADGFAVVTMGEAIELRNAGIRQPILVLQGPQCVDDCSACISHDLWAVIHDVAQLAWIVSEPVTADLKAWLKIDTGMGRLGVTPAQANKLLLQTKPFQWQGILSHLACADDSDSAFTDQQISCFTALQTPIGLPRSLANSAGILAWPESRADWARPGIMLYGCNPLIEAASQDSDSVSAISGRATATDPALTLRPAMQVCAPLMVVRHMQKGAGIGYSQTYHCPQDMSVGLLGIGYGDGFPRVLNADAKVLLGSARCPIIGRVSMDSIVVDLRTAPNAVTGDRAILWGPTHPVEHMAAAAGTINYELLTGIRGTRIYTGMA